MNNQLKRKRKSNTRHVSKRNKIMVKRLTVSTLYEEPWWQIPKNSCYHDREFVLLPWWCYNVDFYVSWSFDQRGPRDQWDGKKFKGKLVLSCCQVSQARLSFTWWHGIESGVHNFVIWYICTSAAYIEYVPSVNSNLCFENLSIQFLSISLVS